MFYSASFLDQLRSRTPLSDLVGRCGVKLVRRGREFLGLSPFHRERTPSFTVADHKRFFHCSGCGAHGDVFSFVSRILDTDFRAAVEKNVIDRTREVWKPRLGHDLSREDARQIAEN